jgi:Asp-tRNA(Asn)/Glu-tRNA(Gln) amidotransferase A subunit family amidase
VKVELPSGFPLRAMQMVLFIEASAAFDALANKKEFDGLGKWPDHFRRARFIPAVDYLRAQRVRTLLMRAMHKMMEGIDLYVGGDDLVITNLTGHPTICLPGGFRKDGDEPERPTSVTFTGKLFGESELLAVAKAYQDATGFHTKRPSLKVSR